MGGGTRSKTTQQPEVPEYLAPLLQQTAQRGIEVQNKAPLDPFLQANPLRVAPLSEKEQQAAALLPRLGEIGQRRVTGANLATSPSFAAAQEAFRTNIDPAVGNQAVLGGLNRSTALGNATAAARAQYLQPLIESEFAREQAGNQQEAQLLQAQIQGLGQAGALERGIQQAGAESEQQDFLRRQALAETGLFGPAGQLLPSAIGQQSTTRGKQGVFTGG